jgi:hypothetical protein
MCDPLDKASWCVAALRRAAQHGAVWALLAILGDKAEQIEFASTSVRKQAMIRSLAL